MRLVPQRVTDSNGRFAFIKCTGQFILVDIDAANNEEWAAQFPGEFQWYPFTPSADDRRALTRARLEWIHHFTEGE